ncbi:hypothetical protein [Xenorhabdus hominickii]
MYNKALHIKSFMYKYHSVTKNGD